MSSVLQQIDVNERSFYSFLKELAQFQNSRELEQSKLYQKLKPEIEETLGHVWQASIPAVDSASADDTLQVVAWNIERGMRSDAVALLLREHPALKQADILLLSELDWGMARTGNRFVARDLAE